MATELNQARAQVERTLKLCDSEMADALIGSPQPDEYGTLVRGTRAAYTMLWMLARSNGMRETQATLKMGAQAMTILLTIVHYAYALGIRRGRESPSPQPSPPEGEGGG